MSPARFAERNSRAILVVTFFLVVGGVLAARSLPSGIYPALHFPRVVVIARAGTTPARSMALTVTRPIEQVIMEVPGIRRVRSKTFRGATEVSAQFEPATDMTVALQRVQNGVAEARGALPAETEIEVEQLTLQAFPILIENLTGGLPTADLHDYGFYVMRPELSRVPGVGRVEVLASDTREIEVVLDPAKLLAAGLTVAEVADGLKAANRLEPVGRYVAEGRQFLVLGSGLWSRAEDIERVPVALRGSSVVTVADLGSVFPGSPDRTRIIAGNGREAAVVSVSQQIGTNILDVRAGVEQAIANVGKTLPAGLRISKVYDLAEFVAASIDNVRDAILIGGLLAVAVLLAFLRDLRLTLVAAVSLPTTIAATFLFMSMFGASINLMSMGGLAVAIGLVIDDAVVVVEGIHRRLATNSPDEAVEVSLSELFAPLVGSTLTTVVVFAPLSLLSGLPGQFFRALSLTLSVAVLLSLVISLTLIPLLGRFAFAHGSHRPVGATRGGLEEAYARTLRSAMRRPRLSLAVVLLLVAGAFLLYRAVGSGFLPHADEGGFVIDCLTPAGTALADTDRALHAVERLLAETPEVASVSRRTGAELGIFATQQNKSDVLVRLKARGKRSRSADEIIAELRRKIHDAVPGLDVEFVQLLQDMIGDLEGNPEPIEVKLFGDDPDALATLAGDVEERITKVKGVVDVVGVQKGNPEVTWRVDPVAAGRIGLTVEQVAGQLRAAWLGEVATDLRLGDRAIPVRVRLPDRDRFDPERLSRATVRGTEGRLVPLASLAHAETTNGQAQLLRENLRPMALVTARLEGRDLGGAVREIQERLASLTVPPGTTWEVGGQSESQRRAFGELLQVFGIAAALVLTILVVQFRALTPALLILGAAPLSLGGAFALLLVTGTELNLSSAMGLILLVGLVVKNGIVMLDYAHRLRDEGRELPDAIAEAARVRLRPILMTTLCTLFGLLPLALGLGAGAELQRPLALAVIGGLTLSTAVTLWVVPTVYVALTRRR